VKEPARLVAAMTLGALMATGVMTLAAPAAQTCGAAVDLAHFNQRFDALEQAIANLQTQSTLANTNNQRQLGDLGSQISTLNSSVAALSERVRR
jgi:TolA-binding protein